MSRLAQRYSVVASTAALFIAVSTGGAVAAAALIDGKNIKSGTVKTKQLAKGAVDGSKVKDGSLTGTDFKAGTLPAGAKGDTGPAGPAGQKGRDAGDPIPSGTTVTGPWRYDDTATASQAIDDRVLITLPGVAPAALTDTTVNFAPSPGDPVGDADPACTGTVEAPTAPAGKVCLYADFVDSNLTAVRGETGGSSFANSRSFLVTFVMTPAGNADVYAMGSWAYTAP